MKSNKIETKIVAIKGVLDARIELELELRIVKSFLKLFSLMKFLKND